MKWGPALDQQHTLWLILHQADLTGNFHFAEEKCALVLEQLKRHQPGLHLIERVSE